LLKHLPRPIALAHNVPGGKNLTFVSHTLSQRSVLLARLPGHLSLPIIADELPHWVEKGVQFFYIHFGPSLRRGISGINLTLGC
jgi:hypothetical protein